MVRLAKVAARAVEVREASEEVHPVRVMAPLDKEALLDSVDRVHPHHTVLQDRAAMEEEMEAAGPPLSTVLPVLVAPTETVDALAHLTAPLVRMAVETEAVMEVDQVHLTAPLDKETEVVAPALLMALLQREEARVDSAQALLVLLTAHQAPEVKVDSVVVPQAHPMVLPVSEDKAVKAEMEEVDLALLMAPQEETEDKMVATEAGPALLMEPQVPTGAKEVMAVVPVLPTELPEVAVDKEEDGPVLLMELQEQTEVKMAVMEVDPAHHMELPVLTAVKGDIMAVMEEDPAHLMEHLDREVKEVREAVVQALLMAHQDKADLRVHQAHHTEPQEQPTVKDSEAVHLLLTALLVQEALPALSMVPPVEEEMQAMEVDPGLMTAAMG